MTRLICIAFGHWEEARLLKVRRGRHTYLMAGTACRRCEKPLG